MAYKARNKMGRFADTAPSPATPLGSEYKIGARVRISNAQSDYKRLATIKYIGALQDTTQTTWIGVEYDEPVGKNDGSLEGKRYFESKMKYGGFVKPGRCEVGDWQQDDIDTDEELNM